jgi:peptide deformylase
MDEYDWNNPPLEDLSIKTIFSACIFPLEVVCLPVEQIDNYILSVLDKMVEMMDSNHGIGLAANQIGLPKRLIVMLKDNKPIKMINPKIIWNSKKIVKSNEGCLSCPGILVDMDRFDKVEVVYTDENKYTRKCTLKGLEAFCIQHEIDHLNGKLIDWEKEFNDEK